MQGYISLYGNGQFIDELFFEDKSRRNKIIEHWNTLYKLKNKDHYFQVRF